MISDITAARQAALETLIETAAVYRPTETPDGAGGRTRTLVAVAAYPARRSRGTTYAGEIRAEWAGQAGRWVSLTVYLPPDADVATGDILEIGGVRYTVEAVREAGAFGLFLAAEVTPK